MNENCIVGWVAGPNCHDEDHGGDGDDDDGDDANAASTFEKSSFLNSTPGTSSESGNDRKWQPRIVGFPVF